MTDIEKIEEILEAAGFQCSSAACDEDGYQQEHIFEKDTRKIIMYTDARAEHQEDAIVCVKAV